jgi:lipid A ethanolaminephosphotransferase
MPLKLFRSTGYSTLLLPGETRQAMHPARLVGMASLWIGLACNAGLWRLAATGESVLATIASAALLAGGSGFILSLLGWRRTIRLAITLCLFGAALLACGLWVQDLPVETLWQQRPRNLLPPWPNFMRWQVPTLMLVLAVAPVVWVWHVSLRRLPGPQQLQSNIAGAIVGAMVFGLGLVLLP